MIVSVIAPLVGDRLLSSITSEAITMPMPRMSSLLSRVSPSCSTLTPFVVFVLLLSFAAPENGLSARI